LEFNVRLKCIEIIGFKSFADKIHIEVDLGITAVVGPNGCGKSNISDAFRWVLGEQSAKSLRGSKMPDVIFAGTATRKPLNFAEVTITLTDIKGELPLDYSEVSITRKLHRSGESEYFINRQLVRLKDVQNLFLDSGMGKDAYSIFEQGKIDQVINLSPLERRYIFEEAAGILRFLQRKKEALKKLEYAEINVARVKDVHNEVEKQIHILEEQAEKAKLYKENVNALRTLEKTLLFIKWDILQKRLTDARIKRESFDLNCEESNRKLEQLLKAQQEAIAMIGKLEHELRTCSDEVYQARSEKAIKSKERQSQESLVKEYLAKEMRFETEIVQIRKSQAEREAERKILQADQAKAESKQKDLIELVSVVREKVKSQELLLTNLQQKQRQGQQAHLKAVQSESFAKNKEQEIYLKLQGALEKQIHVKTGIERLRELEKQLIEQVGDEQIRLDKSTQNVESQSQVFQDLEKELTLLSEEMGESQDRLDRVSQELTNGKARLNVLQRLKAEREGFSSGCKILFAEASNSASPIFQKITPLYEYIIPLNLETAVRDAKLAQSLELESLCNGVGHSQMVKDHPIANDSGSRDCVKLASPTAVSRLKELEASIALVMRPFSQTLVVQTESDFDTVLSICKEKNIKDISLLCLETLSKLINIEPSCDLSQSMAACVKSSQISYAFLKSVRYIKESIHPLHAAIKANGASVCIAEDTFVDSNSVVFFAAPSENNLFARESELKALQAKLFEQTESYEQLNLVVETLVQKRGHILARRDELDKMIRQSEKHFLEVNFSLQRAKQEAEKTSLELKRLQESLAPLSEMVIILNEELSIVKELHQKAIEATVSFEKCNAEDEVQLSEQVKLVQHQMTSLRANESALHEASDHLRKAAHALHILEVKDLEALQHVKRLQNEIEMGKQSQKMIQAQGVEVDQQLKGADERLTLLSGSLTQLESDLSLRRGVIRDLESKIASIRETLKKQEGDNHQISLKIAELQANVQSLEEDFKEKYKSGLSDERKELHNLKSQDVLESQELVEKKIRILKQEIETAGDINMTSIDECEKHKTRYAFIDTQLNDLNLSRQELVAIITELDDESRKIFQDTFEIIRANFKKNFKILFSGGEADLQLTDAADVLQAGIDIIAQPPGKQMRSIYLLSGGEKCLTAMALLFAIFEVKPAPFCILDEIDAPLDDTNVERFLNIVKEFVHACQFIIITHNKRTMAIADKLVGVSMQERGVSKLLSIDFSKLSEEVLK